jgi:hypothetical protein
VQRVTTDVRLLDAFAANPEDVDGNTFDPTTALAARETLSDLADVTS